MGHVSSTGHVFVGHPVPEILKGLLDALGRHVIEHPAPPWIL
jgi:hypothetical protein